MSTTHQRDTLEALWEVVHPDRLPKEAIREVTLTLHYKLDPQTRHIGYAVSMDLVRKGLRRTYSWQSPPDMCGDVDEDHREEYWHGLVVGLAATITGIVLPGKE